MRMDGVSWSASMAQESFSRTRTTADTLSKLASFIARADTKQHPRNQRQQPSHLSTYVCQECGKGFPYATDLLHHQELKHSLPKPHRCPLCGQEFSLRSSLLLHKCDQNSTPCELCHGKSHLCSPCHACTTSTSDPSKPQDMSTPCQPLLLDNTPYACAPCGRGFSQKQALLHHQQAGCSEPPSPSNIVDTSCLPSDSPPLSEGESDSSDAPGSRSRTVYICQLCSRTFHSKTRLQCHKEMSHGDEWLVDTQVQKSKVECTVRGAKKGKMICGLRQKQKSEKKFLNCRSCDMVFRSVSKLCLHRKEKHSREKKCGRETRPVVTKSRRRGTYPCQVCGKVLFHHLSLKAHYRQHTSSCFTPVHNISQSLVSTIKDSRLVEKRPNTVKTSLAKNKTFRAGPGRPRKVARLKDKVTNPETHAEVPEVEVVEEEEDEEEEEEEDDEEEVEREYPCPSCAAVFSLQSQLREHEELHQSSVRRTRCSVCTCEMDTCKWPGSKRQRLYHCVPCQQGFSALDSFLEHCQEHLRVRVEEDTRAFKAGDLV